MTNDKFKTLSPAQKILLTRGYKAGQSIDRTIIQSTFGCKQCKVMPGWPCVGRSGPRKAFHACRIRAAGDAQIEGWRNRQPKTLEELDR